MWRESRWILQPGKNVQPQLSSRGGAGDELTDAAAGVRTARFSSQPRRSVCCPELPHCQHLPFWSWAAAVAWDIVTQPVVTRGTRVPAAPTDTRHACHVSSGSSDVVPESCVKFKDYDQLSISKLFTSMNWSSFCEYCSKDILRSYLQILTES